MDQNYERTAAILTDLQSQELSIIRLSEPILAANEKNSLKRNSDASADALENPSPSSLATDLTHYKVSGCGIHLN